MTSGRIARARLIAAGWFPVSGRWEPTSRRVALTVALVVAGIAVSLSRQAGAPAVDTLWAEDGKEFLDTALHAGPVTALTDVYNYLHLVPRLIAEVAAVLPPAWAAAVFAGTGAAVVVGCGVLVFHASREHVPNVWVRAALGAWFVLLPTAPFETMNQATNLHWYLLPTAFWALLWRPISRSGRIVGVVVVVATALSSPIAVVLAPLALIRAWALAGRDTAVAWALLAATTVQVVVMLGPGSASAGTTPSPSTVGGVLANRFAAGTLLGRTLHVTAYEAVGSAVAIVAVAVLLLLLTGLLTATPAPQRTVGAIALVLAPVIVAALITVRGAADVMQWSATDTLFSGTRYTVSGALFVASAAAVWAGARRRSSWVPVALGILLVVPVTLDLRVANERSEGPRWSDQIAVGRADCRADPTRDEVALRHPPGWTVRVACDRLVPDGPGAAGQYAGRP